jgi:hypothetical protein
MANWMASRVGLDEMKERKIVAPASIRTPVFPPLGSHVTELSQFTVCITETINVLRSTCTTKFIILIMILC